MADKKITDMTELSAGSQATGDLVAVVDVSEATAANKNKKMTMENLFKGIPGQLFIGRSSSLDVGGFQPQIQVSGTDASSASIMAGRFSDNGGTPFIILHKSRGANTSTNTVVQSGDIVGRIAFYGADGSDYEEAGNIECVIDGEPVTSGDTTDMPGRLQFATTDDGAGDATVKMVINSAGNVGIGTTSPASQTWRAGKVLDVNGGSGDFTGELHLGANRGDGNQEVGSINFYDNGQDATHHHIALIEADKNGTTANKRGGQLHFYTKADNTAAPTERMVIKSSGNVQSNGLLSATGAIGNLSVEGIYFYYGSNEARIVSSGPTGTHRPIVFKRFAQSGTEQESMRIDSSGRLLVGTTTEGQASADNLTINDSDDCGITIRSGSTKTGAIFFSDGTSGNAEFDGFIEYNQNSRFMRFGTAESERMRIDMSGNVGIGTNSPADILHLESNTPRLLIDDTNGTGDDARPGIIMRDSGNTNLFTIGNFTTADSDLNIRNLNSSGGLIIWTGNSESARIDSSGNVGIGATAPVFKLDVISGTANTGAYTNNPSQLSITGPNKALTTGGATVFINSNSDLAADTGGSICFSGRHVTSSTNSSQWAVIKGAKENGTSSNLDAYLAFAVANHNAGGLVESIRVNSSGNVGIGSSSPAGRLEVRRNVNGDNDIYFKNMDTTSGSSSMTTTLNFNFNRTGGGLDVPAGQIRAGKEQEWQGAAANQDGYLAFFTCNNETPTERLRIASHGLHHFFGGTALSIWRATAAAGTSDYFFAGMHSATGPRTGGTVSYRVWTNGNVINTNDSYGAISDIKLKENIVDAPSQWDDFKAVRFRKYNFKEETGHETFTQLGVIAQEIETVCPGLVDESPDRDDDGNDLGTTTKSVKYSVLTKKALVALQEAMARIETLEAKVAALEAG